MHAKGLTETVESLLEVGLHTKGYVQRKMVSDVIAGTGQGKF